MLSNSQLQALAETLSAEAELLTDAKSERFETYLLRWSDIGRKIPRAIVLPKSERDCQTVVGDMFAIFITIRWKLMSIRSNGQYRTMFLL